MNAREAIKLNLDLSKMIIESYLADLTDADLLVRPVPGANHIAWQLGHLISAENEMIGAVCPGSMPALPEGFRERYTADTSKLDSAGAFHVKSVYLDLFAQQRAATERALAALGDADLDKPSPEKMQSYTKNVGDVFSLQGTHGVMHAGQWAVIRRKLGRKPLF